MISISVALILLMLFYAPIAPLLAVLNYRPLVWIGQISYGLYLWHWSVRSFVLRITSEATVATEIAYLCLSFLVAALSYYLVEQPFLRLKKRFSVVRERATTSANFYWR